jgi:hypothetical protein
MSDHNFSDASELYIGMSAEKSRYLRASAYIEKVYRERRANYHWWSAVVQKCLLVGIIAFSLSVVLAICINL